MQCATQHNANHKQTWEERRQPGLADRTHSQTRSKTLPVITRSRAHTRTHAQVYKEHRFAVENTHTLVQHGELVFSPAGMCFTVHMTNVPPVVAYSCNGTVPHLTINTLLSAHLLKYDSRPPLWYKQCEAAGAILRAFVAALHMHNNSVANGRIA